MSAVPAATNAGRATSSRYGLRSLARRGGDGEPRDNEAALAGSAANALVTLREETSRRLAQLLEQPGVDESLIADLLGYAAEGAPLHPDSDPDYVGESDTYETEFSQSRSRSARTRGSSRAPARSRLGATPPMVNNHGDSRGTRLSTRERLGPAEGGAESREACQRAAARGTPPRRTESGDLRERLNAQRNSRGGDLRERLNSQRVGREAVTLGQGPVNVADQASNERQQATPVAPTSSPANGLDMVTMIQSLQNQIIEMRETANRSLGVHGGSGETYSPFSAEILARPCNGNFKLPTIPPYDGKTDPNFHVQHYETWMTMQGQADATLCQAFSLTLTGLGFEWFRGLRPGSISSFKVLREAFLARFATLVAQKKSKSHLWSIRQRNDETLRKYLARFNEEASQVERYTDNDAIMAITEGVRESDFLKSIVGHVPATMAELMARARTHMGVEDYLDCRRVSEPGSRRRRERDEIQPEPRKRNNRGGRATGNHNDRPSIDYKPRLADEFKKISATFTPLNTTADRIFALNRDKFRPPPPFKRSSATRDKSKFCEFHQDHGHVTAECFQLRRQIEDLVQEGKLKEYILRTLGTAPNQADRPRQETRNTATAAGTGNESGPSQLHIVSTILGGPELGDSRNQRKQHLRELSQNKIDKFVNLTLEGSTVVPFEMVYFTNQEAARVSQPHNDAIVIKAPVANNLVKRILIDNGSAADVIYKGALDRMQLGGLTPTPVSTPLYGFCGERVMTEGSIDLPITFGTPGGIEATHMVKFLVVDQPSPYNVIIGRPTLNRLMAITSTYHLMMKFPTARGVASMEGDQTMARMCYVQGVDGKAAGKATVFTAYQLGDELPCAIEECAPFGELDQRDEKEQPKVETPDDLIPVVLDDGKPDQVVKIGAQLTPEIRQELSTFLREHKDVFAWTHADMPGIDPEVIVHRLNDDKDFAARVQPRRTFSGDRYLAIGEEVDKLLAANFIREAKHPKWVSNVVMVKKPNGKWRICIDYKDLNKACPKDSFPLPRIEQLVDATAGHELLSFMDAYSGYNQIRMHEADQIKTTFVTNRGLYCYKVMPFGLKNAGATYQRLVNRMFDKQIGRTMEVYVDDMLVKSLKTTDHVRDLREMFAILRQYKMKLNPNKCAFGVESGKFLGYMVSRRGIEANPEKIRAILEMSSPKKPREVQSLAGRIAALTRFVSKATDRCQPFFEALKKTDNFEWSDECEKAFRDLKAYFASPPFLAKPKDGETLFMYLAVSERAVSAVLIREDEGIQWPVYYVSKALLDAETRYAEIEKVSLALVMAAKKLRPYFQAHPIVVRTGFPIEKALQRGSSTRMTIWSQELSEYGIEFRPRTAIKGQALADFIAEFSYEPAPDTEKEAVNSEPSRKRESGPIGLVWDLHVDGASNAQGAGAGIVLTNPDREKLKYALKFEFKASNNEAEYEALIAGLELARKLGVESLRVHCDSQLVVNQVRGDYAAKEPHLVAYLKKARLNLEPFSWYEICRIPRELNSEADALARLASGIDDEDAGNFPVEILSRPYVSRDDVGVIEETPPAPPVSWMTPLVNYLKRGILPEGQEEAKRLKTLASKYTMREEFLYKRGYSVPLLRCLRDSEAKKVLHEVHEGLCGNHSAGNSLAHKILRLGYFWPTLRKDACAWVKRCDKCQRFAHVPHRPPAPLCSVLVPRPFAKWGIDLIGELPMAPRQLKFAIVAVDYFTKWVEAEPLSRITEANTTSFIWRCIICRHGVPESIVTDNAKQFDNARLREICDQLKISKTYSSPRHPQANGQVEAVNKVIKENIKKKLEEKKGAWADELPFVLWAYRTTVRNATGETPFSLAYGVEAVVPIETELPTFRIKTFNEEGNDEALRAELDLIDEKRANALTRLAAQKRKVERHFNSKVKLRGFADGSLVLRKVFPNTQVKGAGVFGPTWEGPYRVRRAIHKGTYELENLEGRAFTHPWNAEHLRQYYR